MLHGPKTSISPEDEFWHGLNDIAADDASSVSLLVEKLDGERDHLNLSSAIRVFVFTHYRSALDASN